MTKLRIAVEGCCHGQLSNIYKTVSRIHSSNPIDLLIILGDFQSLRSVEDMASISIPPKFQRMGDFHRYYNGELVAPIPTIFIGGNHESMRHLMCLPHGGYIAENIYYLGYSNVIWFKGIRIGSLSGIWKEWDLDKARFEWDMLEAQHWQRGIKSLYHVRQKELLPLFMLQEDKGMDIMLSHDWPNEVVYHGDIEGLLKVKPFFKKDIDNKELGSPINSELLDRLQPKWWLSAHLHVKYRAEINHGKDKEDKIETKDTNEIDLDLDSDSDIENDETNKKESNKTTSFLALDKCMPRRQWLEVIELETDITHPSYINDSMYWDPEFIDNLRYLSRHKDMIYSKKLQDYNWGQLQKDKSQEVSHTDDFEIYMIPEYTKNIQKEETEQTKYFCKKFELI